MVALTAEQLVTLAARFYQSREACRALCATELEYRVQLKEPARLLKEVVADLGCNECEAVIHAFKRCEDVYATLGSWDEGKRLMWLMAAAVELSEGILKEEGEVKKGEGDVG